MWFSQGFISVAAPAVLARCFPSIFFIARVGHICRHCLSFVSAAPHWHLLMETLYNTRLHTDGHALTDPAHAVPHPSCPCFLLETDWRGSSHLKGFYRVTIWYNMIRADTRGKICSGKHKEPHTDTQYTDYTQGYAHKHNHVSRLCGWQGGSLLGLSSTPKSQTLFHSYHSLAQDL